MDTNQLTPEAFKARILSKYPDGISSDGTPYAKMDATDLTQRISSKYPDAMTSDGHKYSDFLPKQQTETKSQPIASGIGSGEGLKGGLVQNIVQSVASPFLKVASSANALLHAGNQEAYNKIQKEGTDFGYFGKATPVGAGFDVTKGISENAKPLLSAAGTGAQLASFATPVGSIGKAAATGALMGGGSALEQSGNLTEGLKGAAVGGLLGGVGGTLSKFIEKLPTSLVSSAFPKMNPEQIAQTLESKSIGTASNLLKQSQSSVRDLGNKLGTALKSPNYSGINTTGEDLLSKMSDSVKNPQVAQFLSDTGLTNDELANALKKAVPLKAALVDKLFNEGLSLPDLHRLNSSLGNNTFKLVSDEPAVKAGKDIANAFYHGISDHIKGVAPETAPLFDELSKEYGVRSAINKVANKKSGGLISWRDIIPFLTGTAAGGPLAGLGAAAGERAIENPAVQFAGAKAINAANPLITPVLRRTGLLSGVLNPKQ